MEQENLRKLTEQELASIRSLTPTGNSVVAKSPSFHSIIIAYLEGWEPTTIAQYLKTERSENISVRAIVNYMNAHVPKTILEAKEAGAPEQPVITRVDAVDEMEALYNQQKERIQKIEAYLKSKGVTTSKWLADEIALARDILVKLQAMRVATKPAEDAHTKRERSLTDEEAQILAQIIAEAYATGPLRKFQPEAIKDADNS